MPSPSPSPVAALRAKIETEVSSLATRRISNVPMIATPPTSSGKSAATRLRKKSRESSKRSGKASELGRAYVVLDLLVHLALRERRPAHADASLAGERIRDPRGGVLAALVVGRLEVDGEVGRVSGTG